MATARTQRVHDLPVEISEFFALPELGRTTQARLAEVRRQLQAWGTYRHTTAELEIAARLAWRNHARCVGRSHWRTLTLFDRRDARTADEVATACREHLAWSTNGGRIRPAISVFAPDTPTGPRIRILNRQLIGFAGQAGADGEVVGDPANVALTEQAAGLGWQGSGGRFDVLPLLIEVDGIRSWHTLPPESVLRVPIRHPDLPALDALDLQWYANPAVSDMVFSAGGIDYPTAPFSGWYVCSEVGARDLSDSYRYNALPDVATLLGLDTRHEWSLWRDHALVALTEAVSHSFRRAGVMIVDHHTVSRQFLAFLQREQQAGRDLPTDWSWINPPMSASTTPTFHREYDPPAYHRRPNFCRRTAEPTAIGCPVGNPVPAAG
jgi:nitric-oxide synthase